MRTAPVRPVFSLWAWLVLAPYLLTAFGGYDSASTAREWAVGISTAIEVHLALGIAFLVLGAVDRRLASRPVARWTFVVAAIVLLAIGRPVLVETLQEVFGIALVPTPFLLRVFMNLVVIGIAVLLVHGLIDSASRSLEIRRRLLTVLASLRAQADHIEHEQGRIAASFHREVVGPIADALGRLVARDLPPDQLAEELEWVAELVVRPISARARAAGLDEALADIDPTLPPPRPVPLLLRPAKITAAPAWVVTVVTSAVLMPAEFTVNGIGIGALLLPAGAAAAFLGGLAIRRLPLPWSTVPSIAVLSLCYLLLGGVVIWVLMGPTAANPLAKYYFVYSSVGFATVAVLLAIILSSARELAANQHRIAVAVAQAERRVYRAREALGASADRIARIVESTVQSDIIGTALQLKAGAAEPGALHRLLERVERTLTTGDANPDQDAFGFAVAQAIRGTLTTWSHSLDLEADVDDEALEWLAEHPAAAAIANDAITEGLTNAVRHGDGATARIRIAAADDRVEIVVANPGRLGARSPDGLGLRDLDARARSVRLEQEDGEVVLTVRV